MQNYFAGRLVHAAALCLLAFSVHAVARTNENAAIVDGVQLPAWVEHGGVSTPLVLGARIGARDTIHTGDDARVLLRMPEGSIIKLGEHAVLSLDEIAAHREDGNVVMDAAVHVATGAFRFTTALANKLVGRRKVSIHFDSVTVGIRGTDVWGKNIADREVVCLLEGKIDVTRANETVKLTDPLTFYRAPKGQAAEPIAQVPQDLLSQWSKETEITAGHGVAMPMGQWKVVALVSDDKKALQDVYDNLRAKGFPVQYFALGAGGKHFSEVRIPGLASEEDAKAIATKIALLPGVSPVVKQHVKK